MAGGGQPGLLRRLDRHGQARDVTVHHFVSDQDHDLKFLAHVIAKADEIREDLGSANELFDEAVHRRLVDGEALESVQRDLDRHVEAARGRGAIDADDTVATGTGEDSAAHDLEAIAAVTAPENRASRHALDKLGFRYRGLRSAYGVEGCCYYTLAAAAWRTIIRA